MTVSLNEDKLSKSYAQFSGFVYSILLFGWFCFIAKIFTLKDCKFISNIFDTFLSKRILKKSNWEKRRRKLLKFTTNADMSRFGTTLLFLFHWFVEGVEEHWLLLPAGAVARRSDYRCLYIVWMKSFVPVLDLSFNGDCRVRRVHKTVGVSEHV